MPKITRAEAKFIKKEVKLMKLAGHAEADMRVCLYCGSWFASYWIGNRICKFCSGGAD